MKLSAFLAAEQKAVVERWFEAVLSDYPAETAGFLRKETDQFANPVGFRLRTGLNEIFQELLQPQISEKINKPLIQLLKIRAVQDFSPSKAVGFLLLLKPITRELWVQKVQREIPWEEWGEFEARIDAVTLMAFDHYSDSREQLYRIRIKELKNSIPRIYRDATVRTCTGSLSER